MNDKSHQVERNRIEETRPPAVEERQIGVWSDRGERGTLTDASLDQRQGVFERIGRPRDRLRPVSGFFVVAGSPPKVAKRHVGAGRNRNIGPSSQRQYVADV